MRKERKVCTGDPTARWFASFLQSFFFQTKKKVDNVNIHLLLQNTSSVFLIRSALKNPPSPSTAKRADFLFSSGEGLAARKLQSVFSRQAVLSAQRGARPFTQKSRTNSERFTCKNSGNLKRIFARRGENPFVPR